MAHALLLVHVLRRTVCTCVCIACWPLLPFACVLGLRHQVVCRHRDPAVLRDENLPAGRARDQCSHAHVVGLRADQE